MNKNQKIALGCGGAGCLGLILIVIVVIVLIASGYIKAPGITSYTDSNSNANSNSNSNSNSNANANNNSNTSSSTMSDDAKHRLYQAAGSSNDSDLIMRVVRKIGLGDGMGPDHAEFIKDHMTWAKDNRPFIRSINTPQKAKAYAEEHIND